MKITTNTIYFAFALFAFACFALLPQAWAACREGCRTENNTVLGDDALISLTHGTFNTAIGNEALFMNTTGGANTAIGALALYSNSRGANNTAIGLQALWSNTIGLQNTADGLVALASNTTGSFNTGIGTAALAGNTTGNSNTAIGMEALFSNTTGSGNIALGLDAGVNVTTGSNNIDIGNFGVDGESNTIRIGTIGTHTNAYVAGISGVTVAGGVGVVIDANGHLGTTVSSARFKEAVKPMDKGSETIFALQPVTFRYKCELDPQGIPQFGLVAEDVEKVNPELVARDEHGKPYTVRYEAVNAMLLNEFLKEHHQVQDLKATVARQQKQIDALTAGLQRVRAQVELSKSVPQVIANNP